MKEFRAAIGRPTNDVEESDHAAVFDCAARHLCRESDCRDVTSDEQVLCINCNVHAHKNCSENLLMQTPVDLEFVVKPSDFGRSGKTRFKNIHQSMRHTIFFCILCKEKIHKAKIEAISKRKPPPENGITAPRERKGRI